MNTLTKDNGVITQWKTTCGYKSLHPGGANFVLGDGSVRFLSMSVDFSLFNALGTRAGGEVAQLP